jgi:hypothetical protein
MCCGDPALAAGKVDRWKSLTLCICGSIPLMPGVVAYARWRLAVAVRGKVIASISACLTGRLRRESVGLWKYSKDVDQPQIQAFSFNDYCMDESATELSGY